MSDATATLPESTTRQTFVDALAQLKSEQAAKVDVVAMEGKAIRPVVATETVVDPDTQEPRVIRTPSLAFDMNTGDVEVDGRLNGAFLPVQRHAHRQIQGRFEIGQKYYDKMLEQEPELWVENVQTWIDRDPRPRLLRTFAPNGEPGAVRAYLSDGFRVLDNLPFVENVLEACAAHEGGLHRLDIPVCKVDEDRVYLKIHTERTRATSVGDRIRAGIIVSNSEVGAGSVSIAPYAEDLACTNGMVSTVNFRKVHLGGRLAEGWLSQETVDKEAEAVWSTVRDFAIAALSDEHFGAFFEQIEAALLADVEVRSRIAVANVVSTNPLQGQDGGFADSILDAFAGTYAPRYGKNRWAMVQAITEAAHEAPTFRAQVAAESLGGELLAMSNADFERMVNRDATAKELARIFPA